ncbi:MAG: O-antigen ligase family protein [bacterium]|nr:O-antigen ligase family protein [bacterium]
MKQKIFATYRKNLLVVNFSIFSILVFFAFSPSLSDCFNLPKFVVALVGIVLFLCYFAMKFLNMGFVTFYRNPLYLPLGLFILWQCICLIFAPNKIAGLSEIGLFFMCSTLIFLVPFILRRGEDVFLFVRILVISSLAIALYGILQHFGLDFLQWEIKNSALSTFGRRNFAGEYLVLILPWALMLLLITKKFHRLFFALTFIILMLHLFLTFTRASWIGFIFSMLVVLFLILKFRLVPGIIKIALVFFIFFGIFKSHAGVFQFEPGTVKSRILIWKTCIELIKNRPIFGHGTGNFEIAYYKIAAESRDVLIPPNLRVDKAHNDFLEIAVETGIIGLALFLFFIFTIYKMAWSIFTIRNNRQPEKFVSIFAISSISGILVNSLASFPLQNTVGCFFFFLNCGILSRMYFTVLEQKAVEKKFNYPGIAFLCMASICAVIVFSFAVLYSSYALEKSRRITRAVIRSGDPVLWLVAEMYAKNAVSYNPFNIKSYFHLGKLYLVAGQLDSAYDNFIKALKFNPYSEQILLNLGIVEQRRKKFPDAERYFLKAYSISRNNPEILKSIGLFYLETQNYEKAIKFLTKAHELTPDDNAILIALAKAYENTGNTQREKELRKKIESIKPAKTN